MWAFTGERRQRGSREGALAQESGGRGQVQAVVLSSWLLPHLDGEGGSGVSAASP